jgi:hypothetical protein
LKVKIGEEIMEHINKFNFKDIDVSFKIIQQDTAVVLINSDDKLNEQIIKIKKENKLTKEDFRKIQDSSVNLYQIQKLILLILTDIFMYNL